MLKMFSLKNAPAPTTADELWRHINYEFGLINGHCEILHLQTKEEAKARSWKMELGDFGSEYEGLVRFRKGDIREFLVENFEEIVALRPTVAAMIDARQLTPEFIFYWTRLSFAYGYIMNNICSIDDDLASSRAGAKKARTRERKWVALVLFALMKRGLSRKEADERLVRYLREQIQNRSALQSFAKRILNRKDDWLSTIYKEAKFYPSKMKRAAAAEVDIPPLPEL
jgi:hypothetical protein